MNDEWRQSNWPGKLLHIQFSSLFNNSSSHSKFRTPIEELDVGDDNLFPINGLKELNNFTSSISLVSFWVFLLCVYSFHTLLTTFFSFLNYYYEYESYCFGTFNNWVLLINIYTCDFIFFLILNLTIYVMWFFY